MELNYRLANTKIFEGKTTEKLVIAQNEAKKAIDGYDHKIRHLKTLIKEIEDGKFQI